MAVGSWGPVEHPTGRGGSHPATGAEGTITQQHVNGGDAPRHPIDYNATDGRHNRESGLAPWKSVDPNSGIVTDTDWETPVGHFVDGPGVWRQT
jgi:hypothetical protein